MPDFHIKFKVYSWDLRCDDGHVVCFHCSFVIANVSFAGNDSGYCFCININI